MLHPFWSCDSKCITTGSYFSRNIQLLQPTGYSKCSHVYLVMHDAIIMPTDWPIVSWTGLTYDENTSMYLYRYANLHIFFNILEI